MDQTRLFYADVGEISFLFIEGMANHVIAYSLKEFIGLWENNRTSSLIIDLKDCTYIDSTVMGILASGYSFTRKTPDRTIKLINPTPTLISALTSLGLHKFLQIIDIDIPLGVKKIEIPINSTEDKNSMKELIIESHQVLSDISPENQQKFRILMETLSRSVDNKEC